MTVKAIFFDIDGTLVRFGQPGMSETMIATLDRARAKGIKVFVATGRPEVMLTTVSNYQFDGYILMNGAIVRLDGKTIHKELIELEDARNIVDIALRDGYSCACCQESDYIASSWSDYARNLFTEIGLFLPRVVEDFATSGLESYQYTVFMTDEEFEKVMAPHLKNTVIARWHPAFTDVIPSTVSKAVGIEKIIQTLGFSKDEVMAFGDGGNDIDMLKYVGMGVAMGNATDAVKQHADYVTDSVDEEGVKTALEHFGVI